MNLRNDRKAGTLNRRLHLSMAALRLACLLWLVTAATLALAQTADEPGCRSLNVTASTDRPTVSSATETTQCGVVELLGGIDRVWVGRGLHQDDTAQGAQFGLTPSIDLHYSGNLFFHSGGHSGPLAGFSDSYAGVRYRFTQQSHLLPSLGAFYTLKVPTASTAAGLGSGRYDDFLSLLVSRDLPKVHLDFNLSQQLIGRPLRSGYDQNQEFVLFGSLPLLKKLTFVAGGYGFNALNSASPAYAVSTVGFDWQVAPRLILDLSMDEGLTAGAPRKRFGFGFTDAPANLYALLRPRTSKTF